MIVSIRWSYFGTHCRGSLSGLIAFSAILLFAVGMPEPVAAQSGIRGGGSGGRSISSGAGGRSVSSSARSRSFSRPSRNLGGAALSGSGARSVPSENAQPGSSSRPNFLPETIQGTLVSVKQIGRKTTLVVRDQNGKQADIVVTPKMQAAFFSPATAEIMTNDQFVSANARRAGNQWVADQYVVHVGYGKRDLPSKLEPAARNSNDFFVSGRIISTNQDASASGKGSITLRVGGRQGTQVQYGPDAKVTVRNADLNAAPAGSVVEVSGIRASNGAFQIQSIQLRQPETEQPEPSGGSSKKITAP